MPKVIPLKLGTLPGADKLVNSLVYILNPLRNWFENIQIPPIMVLLQFAWVFSHFVVLTGTLAYGLSFMDLRINMLDKELFMCVCFRMANIGAVLTYIVVLYRHSMISSPTSSLGNIAAPGNSSSAAYTEPLNRSNSYPISIVLRSENAQLLGFALLWLATRRNICKLLPFAIYSFLNLGYFLFSDLFPDSSFSKAVTPLMNFLEEPLLISAADLDIVIFCVLIKEVLLGESPYVLSFYALLWSLRTETSVPSRQSLHKIVRVIDWLMVNSNTSDTTLANWETIKRGIHTLVPMENDTVPIINGSAYDDMSDTIEEEIEFL